MFLAHNKIYIISGQFIICFNYTLFYEFDKFCVIIKEVLKPKRNKMSKIILVEDEQILLKALSIQLLSAGFEVLTANNGESGLELIKKEKPDAILLDIMMPKMNGFEVLEKLKKDELLKNIPVIVLSNQGQEAEKQKGMELGAVDYYVKSDTDLTDLTAKVQAVLKN